MARPIKETPILYGEDARRFEAAMKRAETQKISDEERKKIREGYEFMKSISKF